MDRNKKVPIGIRKEIVERSCTHAIVRIKMFKHWFDGDWIYLHFEAEGKGNYLIKEVITLKRQWQKTFGHGKAPLIEAPMHEWYAARLHAIKAIETKRRKFGDQGELKL